MSEGKKNRMPLFWRLMGFIMVCWIVLLCFAMILTMRYALMTLEDKIDDTLKATVLTLGESPSVRRVVEAGACDREISDYLDNLVENTDDMEYITICGADSIRIYSVAPELIGQPFEGGDEGRALAGESYLSDTDTSYGHMRRAFHPVRDENGTVIGFIMASATGRRIDELRDHIYATYVRLFLILMAVSLVICGMLAVYLGRNLRGVRPEDLLRVYLTQNDILNSLDEGLISYDNSGKVRLVNAAAARMLGHREDLLVGRHVDELLLAENGESLRDHPRRSFQSNHANILVRTVPLPDSNLWARQVLLLADKSEAMRQAEQLNGTRHIVNALRANTHEFMNKLQVLSGLLQMGYTKEALEYIGGISAYHEKLISPVMKLIRNSNVAALILGKQGNTRELNIELALLSNSHLPEHSRYLSTEELVTVVGNLLENAMEAVNAQAADALRSVVLQITEDDKGLFIMVSDTGEGIREEDLPHIFETGFSTKAAAGRGIGMKLIREISDAHGGTVDVDTEPGSGTTITVIFRQERGGSL